MPNFLYHRNTGRMFQIVGGDKVAGTITLKNDMATFSDTFDKDRFKMQGYFPISGDTEDDARAAAEAKVEAEGGTVARPSAPKSNVLTLPTKKPAQPTNDDGGDGDEEDMGLGDDDE